MCPYISVLLLGTTDLAVIFRSAVLAHPNRETQPSEYGLSQEVLEFLIAHQDRFMPDVSPPPMTSAGLVGSDEGSDVAYSSDEGSGENEVPPVTAWSRHSWNRAERE